MGTVLSGTGGIWRVRTDEGETREATLRGRLKQGGETPKLAVGDRVVLEPDERGESWSIAEIAPRHSRLARRAPGGAWGERVVAANLDQVVVVFAAAKPEPHPRMLDRFLVIAEANELPAHIVVNKVELVGLDAARARWAGYERIGYPVHYTSVKADVGLEELREVLRGRISALTGPSGVGKSSLINALFPGIRLRVGEISASVNKGRHTTVGASLHPIPDGGFVCDTPGLREVGLWGLLAATVDHCFPEFRPVLGECRFADCAHDVEPGCAVRALVETGGATRDRWESYLKLRAELAEGEREW